MTSRVTSRTTCRGTWTRGVCEVVDNEPVRGEVVDDESVDGRLSYQSSYGFASGQIPRRSQGTLLPSSGEPKVSNPWNNVQRMDSI
jgi:hypothetical protein